MKTKNQESVWKAYKSVDASSRQYLKLKRFKKQVRRCDFILYLIEEHPDRFHFWYTSNDIE